MSIKAKAKKALPYSVGISLVKIVVTLFGMVLLIRYLPAEEYAIYALLSGLPLLINLLMSFGYDHYLLRYIPRMERPGEISLMVSRIMLTRFLAIIPICLGLVLLFDVYDDRFGLTGYGTHFTVYQLAVPLHIGYLLLEKVLHAKFYQKDIMFIHIAYELFRLVIIFYGVYHQEPLYFFVLGFVLAEGFQFLIIAILFVRYYGWPQGAQLLRKHPESKEEREYRWGSYIEKLGSSFLGTDIDRYILAYVSTNAQVAIYAIATKILTKLLDIYPNRMFRFVTEAAIFSKYDQSNDSSGLNRMFQFMYNVNNLIGFLFITLFMPFGQEMLLLVFEQDYTVQAYWPLAIFLFFLIFYNMPLTLIARTIKKPKILIYAKLSFIPNLALGIPLAYWYGALGMAIATVFSVVLQNLIVYQLINRYIQLRIPFVSTLRCLINSAIVVGLAFFLNQYDIHLFLQIALALGLYLLTSKLNSVFDETEIKLFHSLLPKRFVRLVAFLI